MESELDAVERSFDGWEGGLEAMHPGLGPAGSGGSSAPRSVPAGQRSKASPFTGPSFESGGRHILYCGTDLPMDGVHWHAKNHVSRSADHGPGAGEQALHQFSSERAGAGPQLEGAAGGRLTKRAHSSIDEGAPAGAAGADATRIANATANANANDEEDDEEEVEMETDTPGGYHVAALLTHHQHGNPDEITVEAHIKQ